MHVGTHICVCQAWLTPYNAKEKSAVKKGEKIKSSSAAQVFGLLTIFLSALRHVFLDLIHAPYVLCWVTCIGLVPHDVDFVLDAVFPYRRRM